MTSKGSAAEGILLKKLLEYGIEAEHGSPSRPGDIIIPPNVIIEIKDPKEKSFSFRSHSGKGEQQWEALKEKQEKFPWLEVYYVVRFARKDWRFYAFPKEPKPLKLKDGSELVGLFDTLRKRQGALMVRMDEIALTTSSDAPEFNETIPEGNLTLPDMKIKKIKPKALGRR
jgi:hypothetical protein